MARVVNQAAPMLSKSYHWLAVALIVLLGGWLRVGAVLNTEVAAPLRADAGQYVLYAYNLKFHGVYSRSNVLGEDNRPVPDAFRNPGYALALMPFIERELTHGTLLKITMAQALISTLLLLLVYSVASRVLPHGYSLAVTALTALSPHLVNANLYILTESLFSVCIVLLLWALGRESARSWWISALLVGSIIGLGTLVRPSLQYFIVPATLLLLWHYRQSFGIKGVVAAALAFLLVYSPWLIRNEVQFGFSTDSMLKIATLHHGMYPGFKYQDRPETFGFPYRFDPDSKHISSSMDSVLDEIGSRFAKEPARHLQWFLIGKPAMLWSWNIVQGQGESFVYQVSRTPYATSSLFSGSHALMEILHWPLVVLALIGSIAVWLAPERLALQRGGLLVARMGSLIVLYFTALHMVGAPFPRYAVPLRPVMYLMALVAFAPATVYLRRWFSERTLQAESQA